MANPLGYVYSRADALKRQLYDMITSPKDYASMMGGQIVEGGQEREALMNQAFADQSNPLKITDEKALAALTDKIMQGELGISPLGITAYHGSPYLFKQFDPMKKGTGEGSQIYGVGAGYTAESPAVAKSYRDALAVDRTNAPETLDLDVLQSFIGKEKPEVNKVLKDIIDGTGYMNDFVRLVNQEGSSKLKSSINKQVPGYLNSSGYLYKGEIPDEILPKFLDWDKPIKEQSQEVQDLAKKYKIESDDLGGDLVAAVGKTVEGSKIMEDAGIRGIKYFDANSRNRKYGSQNFIPFSSQDYKIQEINDLPIQDWINKGLLAP